MFETSVVQASAKAAAHRPLLLSLSIGAHAAAVIGAVAMSVASVSLPKQAPNQVTIPVFRVFPPLQGDDGVKKTTVGTPPQQTVKRQVTPSAVVAPTTLPEQVVPVTAQASTTDTGPVGNTASGPATGDSSGPGVPWGSKEGVGEDGPPVTGPAPKIYTTSDGVKPPVVLRRVVPPYPAVPLKMRLNGWVILECIIDQSGHIRDAHVVKSSFAAFEQPALDAVYQWQFAPGTLNGQPVDVQFDLKVTFQIH